MGFQLPSIQQATSVQTARLQTILGKPAVAFTGFLVGATAGLAVLGACPGATHNVCGTSTSVDYA